MSAETIPLALGECDVERGSECEEMEGLEEPEATEKASSAGLGSDLNKVKEHWQGEAWNM